MLGSAHFQVNIEFGGHGVGSTLHQDRHIPNIGEPGRGYVLRLLLAMEPRIMDGTSKLVAAPDGWPLRQWPGPVTILFRSDSCAPPFFASVEHASSMSRASVSTCSRLNVSLTRARMIVTFWAFGGRV